MKFKKSMPLIAVGVFVLFIVMQFLPWLQQSQLLDSCIESGGRWDYEAETCVTDGS